MNKIIGGFILGVVFAYLVYMWFNPPYKMFKCKYYGKGWDFVVTDKGIDIECVEE